MSDPQYVYFIKPVGMDGPIKIGCSTKPVERLITLSAWSPFPLEIVGAVPGDFTEENRLHRRFSDLHTRKEWFMSSPLLRQTIERILGGVSIKEACKDLAAKQSLRNQKRPAMTQDRKLFLDYGRRIRNATRSLWKRGENGRYDAPADIELVMHSWRCDRANNHLPVLPTQEQFARIEEFLSAPEALAVFIPWTHHIVREKAA